MVSFWGRLQNVKEGIHSPRLVCIYREHISSTKSYFQITFRCLVRRLLNVIRLCDKILRGRNRTDFPRYRVVVSVP